MPDYPADTMLFCEAECMINEDADGIKRSEANLNAILNHAHSGYVLYDTDLRIVAFNALAQEFSHLLYSKKLAEGNHLLSYFPEENHNALLAITRRAINGKKINYETYFNIDDNEKWLEIEWLNVKNDDNKNWGFILTSKDITEKKLAAIKLEKITNDLVRRNNALEQFANIISHNLKAPVANIISLVKMTSEEDGFEKDQALDYILSSSIALSKVIDDINQILEVKQNIHAVKEQVFFDQVLCDIKTSINYLIKQENVVITTDFASAPHIFTIRSFLYSIFYNLILNSIKYKQAGISPGIEISAKQKEQTIVLTFKDNAKGIDLVKHGDKLFGLYKRFDTTVEGTGLGLFMIKSQIEELGGKISVESKVGTGTIFTVVLPAIVI